MLNVFSESELPAANSILPLNQPSRNLCRMVFLDSYRTLNDTEMAYAPLCGLVTVAFNV